MAALDAIADELYALTPGEFTAARNLRGKEAPEAKALKKPSAAAWAINQFARRRSDELDQVFSLGEQLREAQEELNSAVLRALGSKRRSLVSAIATQVSDLATELGDPIGASVHLEVELTLQAAMADPRAADAVRTGRLVRSLSTAGLDEVDLDGAVAGSVPHTARPAKKTGPSASELKKKQRERADAEAADHAARAAKTEADDRLAEAKQRTAELSDEIDALTSRLVDARAELSQSRAASKKRAAEQRSAALAADRAADRLRDVIG